MVQQRILGMLKQKVTMRLTHWSQVMHIGISKLFYIFLDNGQSPLQCQAIIWTNVGILFAGPLETTFNEIRMKIQQFSFKDVNLKM